MRKLSTRGRALFLAVVLFCLGIGVYPMTPCDAKGNGALEAKNGVVSIQFYLKGAALYYTDGKNLEQSGNFGRNGEGLWSSGSGFFVGARGSDAQYIVTNHHVVADYIDANEGELFLFNLGAVADGVYEIVGAESCELRVYYDDNDYDVAYVDCYGDMDKLDLAVLKIKNPTKKRKTLPIQIPTEDMVGETVYTVGFPGNAENSFTSASSYGLNDITMHKGAITKFVRNSKGVERIQIDATIQHGNSGGPLVTESGNVIGVNTNVESNVKYGTQVEVDYYSINSSDLVGFLDKNNIPYEMAKSGINLILILIIVGGIAVVAIAVVVVVLLMKKSAPKGGRPAGAGARIQPPPRPQMQAQPQPQIQSQPQMRTQPRSQPQPQAQAQSSQRAFIRSMASQHNGMTLVVNVAPAMIGRDKTRCNLVFAEGTPGVSGRHCSVSYNAAAREFVVTDLGSTYGTFTMNGQKLNANAPCRMRPGDSFYVGDPVNVIRLELG